MFRKLIKIARYYFGNKNEILEKNSLGGITLTTVRGTIRSKPDKDDSWFARLAANNSYIFDIGCNIGFTGLLSAIQNNSRQLLLIDPNPKALAVAAKNMILNGFTNKCRFYNAFVSDKMDDEIQFFTVGVGSAGSMYRSHAETASIMNSSFLVKTVTSDYLMDTCGWIPDLIKIDVEGAEYLVLKGAEKIAKLSRTIFMVEMHSSKELPMLQNASNILTWCQKNQYKAWYMSDALELTDPNQITHRGRCHLLLQPSIAEYPDYLKAVKEGSAIHPVKSEM